MFDDRDETSAQNLLDSTHHVDDRRNFVDPVESFTPVREFKYIKKNTLTTIYTINDWQRLL